MTANHSKKSHDGQDTINLPGAKGNEDQTREDESISDDDSRSSSESSSTEDSSTESPPTESMNRGKIRQNVRELLQTDPDGSNIDQVKENRIIDASAIGDPIQNKMNGYQSYHDAPTVRMSSTSQPTSYSDATATKEWVNDHNENDGELSVTDVASLALSCVAQCLTEGYRAASNYYGAHDHTQYPSMSGANDSLNYQQPDSYNNEAYGNITSTNFNDSGNDSYSDNDGRYSDSYQTKVSDNPNGQGEVMDRGLRQHPNQTLGQNKEQPAQQVIEKKEEWSTVEVPSTYQGGRVGGAN